MNGRDILAVLLVAALLVPTASATVTQPQSSVSQSADTAADQGPDADATANYTRIYIEDRYRGLELKPGENESFTVTVENGENESVTVDPHMYRPRVGERPVEQRWVTIDAGETTLAAGAERTFTVNVSVPDDAELANYRGTVAFTDETVTYPGRPAQPVHATSFTVDVYEEPTVAIVGGEYLHTRIQAGERYTHSIVVENTGDQAVPVNPQVRSERERSVVTGGDRKQFQRSWVDIESPSEIEAGSTATVNVTIAPPADAEVGNYDVNLDLGLRDPARDGRNDYWQRVRLGFQVWDQPEEPFTASFQVSEDTTALTLALTSRNDRHDNAGPTSFDVSFVTPSGTVVDAERVQTANTGHVTLTGDEQSADDVGYSSEGEQQRFTYRVQNPESGEWTAQIMPENAIQFGYEVVRNES